MTRPTASSNIDRGRPAAQILAVDDNAGNRLVLDALLERAGLRADFATDGVEAVEAASIVVYDLILMDLQMPRTGGIEAARAIRAGGGPNAGTPIVALTGHTHPDTLAACRAAGMVGHVSKPIVPAALFKAITAALTPAAIATEAPLARAKPPR